jgi:non-specific serine/threonine protein kinase
VVLLLFRDERERTKAIFNDCLERFTALADAWGIGGALFYLGRLAGLNEDWIGARDLYISSLEHCRLADDRVRVAVTLSFLADALHELGDAAAAVTALHEAVTLWRRLGASEQAARLEATLAEHLNSSRGRRMKLADATELGVGNRSTRHGVPNAHPGSSNSPAQLTRREREVLILLGNGHSNRDIARELIIGVRTVETHVEHILRKLNLQSRAQAMLLAREQSRVR